MSFVLRCHRNAAALAISCLFVSSLAAQPYYPNMNYGQKVELAPGVTWQELSNPSPLWRIHVIEVDMENRNVELVPLFKQAGNVPNTPNERTSSMAMRADAVAAVNAAFYDTSNFTTVGYTVIDGQFIGGSGLSMHPQHNLSILGFSGNHQEIPKRTKAYSNFTVQHPQDWEKITDLIAGVGHAVTSNGVVITQDNEGAGFGHYGERHPRTAIGYSLNPYRAFLVTIDGRQPAYSVGMTYPEVAQLMADLGIEQSLNLDGGGSTTAWVQHHGVVNRGSDGSERAVVSGWGVVEANTMDNTVEEVTVSGDWTSDTAHSQLYYLDHLTTSGASAPSSVTWAPDLGRSGLYKVYAWWTDNADRATAAPYSIATTKGTETIPVDQTQNGGKWNLLGTFGFEAGTAGTVTLTNAAPGTVSADAVRFVRVADLPTVVPADYVITETLFETDFETDQSSNFAFAHRNINDNAVNFLFDYSTFSQVGGGHPTSIPQSPRSSGSGTRALRLSTNLVANIPNAVTATLTAIEPRENMRITFDAWINYTGGAGGTSSSTEFLTLGASANPALYAHTSTTYTHPNAANQPFSGFYFAISGEGGSSADYRYYDGNGTGGATGSNAARANFLGTSAFEHLDFSSVFKVGEFETVGAPGKAWVRWETLILNGRIRLIATNPSTSEILLCDWFEPNSNATITDLLPHFGTYDPLATSASPSANNFVLIDNLKVESIIPIDESTTTDGWSIY